LKIVRGLESLKNSYSNVVLTIGNYDGVHLGHQKILSDVIKKAREINGTSMVMTFEPHPVKVLSPERDIKLLTTFEEKAKIIGRLGIDVLLCVNFDINFASLKPDEFVKDILVEKLKVKAIIVGSNYTFGRHKKGKIPLLRRRGKKFGFSVKAVRQVKIHGTVVSSSAIRSLLLRGAVHEASLFLGRPYSIEGVVIKGKGRGAKLLNVPTANIETPFEVTPKDGVYAVRIELNDNLYDGVANIGKNPTFGNSLTSYEVHIFDFNDNILDKRLKIYFIDRIRSEKKFPDIKALEEQIRKDITKAKEILGEKRIF
jgi:riboflavin kinase/FMN adenylyltransferase